MPDVIFVDPDHVPHRVECSVGCSLMRAARQAGVPGIVAECGGCLTCGTCHVHLDPDTFAALLPPAADEEAMLELLVDRSATSRLSCQLRMVEALIGTTLRVGGGAG